MSNRRELVTLINTFEDGEIGALALLSHALKPHHEGGLGYLAVCRASMVIDYPNDVSIAPEGDNRELASELGLPPNSNVVLATSHPAKAVVATAFGDMSHDPLSKRLPGHYGWASMNDNTAPGELPYAAEGNKETCEAEPDKEVGRIIFVDPAEGFTRRPDSPDEYFIAASAEQPVEGVEWVAITNANVSQFAVAGLFRWGRQGAEA